MNANPEKPDPEQFARVVLWHLCTLQAEMALLQSDFIWMRGKEAGASDSEILGETSKHGKLVKSRAESLYLDALKQANVKSSPTFPYNQNP
jgi:hypothetical protein